MMNDPGEEKRLMDPDRCPRCGLPEHTQLRLRVWLVYLCIALAAAGGFVLGRVRR